MEHNQTHGLTCAGILITEQFERTRFKVKRLCINHFILSKPKGTRKMNRINVTRNITKATNCIKHILAWPKLFELAPAKKRF